MKSFSTLHRVSHSAANMFALVGDVERYPEFLPLCEGLTVQSREPGENGGEILLADMTVAYKMFHETFASRVTLDPEAPQVLVENVDGPFRHLENRWQFTPVAEDACDIEFYVAYEFASRSMQVLAGAVFEKAFRKFVHAFEERANIVYRTPGIASAPGVTAS